MKTIALQEKTFEILEELKEMKNASSFNELILQMLSDINKTPASMFGTLKGKAESFTTKERHNLWGEE